MKGQQSTSFPFDFSRNTSSVSSGDKPHGGFAQVTGWKCMCVAGRLVRSHPKAGWTHFRPLECWYRLGGEDANPLFFGLEDYGSATSKAVCNFIFASHCQGACLIFSQLAGTSLSKLGGFRLHLEGSCRGKKRAGCGEVHVAMRMMLAASGRKQIRLGGGKEEQGRGGRGGKAPS